MQGSYGENLWNLSWVRKEVRTKGENWAEKMSWGRSMNCWNGGALDRGGRRRRCCVYQKVE